MEEFKQFVAVHDLGIDYMETFFDADTDNSTFDCGCDYALNIEEYKHMVRLPGPLTVTAVTSASSPRAVLIPTTLTSRPSQTADRVAAPRHQFGDGRRGRRPVQSSNRAGADGGPVDLQQGRLGRFCLSRRDRECATTLVLATARRRPPPLLPSTVTGTA